MKKNEIQIKEVLGDFFCRHHNVDEDNHYEIEYVDAKTLVCGDRLDLIPKICWLESIESGKGVKFYSYLYQEHIKAITGRTQTEAGKEELKNSVASFEQVFRELRTIKDTGFDCHRSIIPVSNNGVIMDGAHRTAIGYCYNLSVPTVKLNIDYPSVDARFFLNNLMDAKLVEKMLLEYCKHTEKKVYVVCMWPKSYDKESRKKAEKIIAETGTILYKKELSLSYKALRNLMIQIYCSYDWLGGVEDNFAGASEKARNCWKKRETTVFYFIEGPQLEEILDIKKRIRDIYGLGNHSVHMTDNTEETIQIANIILNKNSIHLLTYGCPDKYKQINGLIIKFKEKIETANLSVDDFLIDSSGVLAIYGLRDANDLDYLSMQSLDFFDDRIDSHNDYLCYHKNTLEDLIYNPDNYFYYCGVKFVSIDNVKIFKLNRNEKKDVMDVQLIDSIASNKLNLGLLITKSLYEARRYFLFYFRKFKMKIKKIPLIGSIYIFLKRLIKGK